MQQSWDTTSLACQWQSLTLTSLETISSIALPPASTEAKKRAEAISAILVDMRFSIEWSTTTIA